MGTVNGCCVKAQFSMDVVTEDDKTIIGDIKDSHSQEPAHFAREIVKYCEKIENPHNTSVHTSFPTFDT